MLLVSLQEMALLQERVFSFSWFKNFIEYSLLLVFFKRKKPLHKMQKHGITRFGISKKNVLDTCCPSVSPKFQSERADLTRDKFRSRSQSKCVNGFIDRVNDYMNDNDIVRAQLE